MKFKGLLKFNPWVAFSTGIVQNSAKLLKNGFSKIITKHKVSNKIQETNEKKILSTY